MVRWDSPLISIPWDEEPPFEAIWDVVIKGEKKGPTPAVMQVSLSMMQPCQNRNEADIAACEASTKHPSHSHKYHFRHHNLPSRSYPGDADSRFLSYTFTTCLGSDGVANPTSAHA